MTEPAAFKRFVELLDELEAIPIADLLVGIGRNRARLGQRASSAADRMSEIMERLETRPGGSK